MTRKRLLIMASFLSILFGCGQKNKPQSTSVFPEEKFSVIQATLKDKPIVGSINMAYKDYYKKNKYPWCLKIYIALDLENLFENGLPKENESAIANKLEDELLSEIQKITTAHYIGHVFNDTFLDIYIYLEEPEKVHQYLQTQINKEGLARPFKYEIEQDPKWTNVNPFFN